MLLVTFQTERYSEVYQVICFITSLLVHTHIWCKVQNNQKIWLTILKFSF